MAPNRRENLNRAILKVQQLIQIRQTHDNNLRQTTRGQRLLEDEHRAETRHRLAHRLRKLHEIQQQRRITTTAAGDFMLTQQEATLSTEIVILTEDLDRDMNYYHLNDPEFGRDQEDFLYRQYKELGEHIARLDPARGYRALGYHSPTTRAMYTWPPRPPPPPPGSTTSDHPYIRPIYILDFGTTYQHLETLTPATMAEHQHISQNSHIA